MSKGKGAASYVVAVAAMMMFFTGCETTKHAEIMSAEDLAKRAQVVAERSETAPGEAAGIPLGETGISQESLDFGEKVVPGTPPTSLSDIEPEAPPSATLREQEVAAIVQPEEQPTVDMGEEQPIVDMGSKEVGESAATFEPTAPPQPSLGMRERSAAEMGEAPVKSGIVESQVEAGPSGYEGQQFVQGLTPSDFVPEGPPQPFLGEVSPPAKPRVETAPPPKAEKKIVRIPEESKAAEPAPEPMEPLMRDDIVGLAQEEPRGMDEGAGLEHVYFDFDQYVIRPDAVSTLQANAQLLNGKYKNSGVLIEGHCDERGTRDYNLVLGERRAQAVKNYLVDLGVSSSRIRIVSYGKERPSCSVSEEWCWQKNRRGHFVLQ